MSGEALGQKDKKEHGMGEIRKYTCECGYETELPVGVGMMGMNMQAIQRVYPEDMLTDFLKEKEKENIESYVNKNQLGICTHCNTLVIAPNLTYTLKDGTEKQLIGTCPECGKEFSPVSDMDDVHCPKCGKKMASETAGRWD